MTKLFTTLMTLFALLLSLPAFASNEVQVRTRPKQKIEDKYHAKLKTNLAGIAIGLRGVDVSTQIGYSPWTIGAYVEQTALLGLFFGYGAGGSVAYHFNGNPYHDTWYLGSAVTYRSGEAVSIFTTENLNYNVLDGNLMMGYQ